MRRPEQRRGVLAAAPEDLAAACDQRAIMRAMGAVGLGAGKAASRITSTPHRHPPAPARPPAPGCCPMKRVTSYTEPEMIILHSTAQHSTQHSTAQRQQQQQRITSSTTRCRGCTTSPATTERGDPRHTLPPYACITPLLSPAPHQHDAFVLCAATAAFEIFAAAGRGGGGVGGSSAQY